MPVFCKLPAVFLTFPFRDARFAVYQCSGVAAYFEEISLEGYRQFRKDRVGRQVRELVHCGRGALGAWSFTLGWLMNPWRVWVRTREQTSAADVKAGVCYQITRSRRGRWSLPQAPCPKGSSAAGRPYGAELFSLPGGGLLREPSPRRRYLTRFFKLHFGLSETCESDVKPVLPPIAIFRAGVTGLGAVWAPEGWKTPAGPATVKTWLWARAPSAPRLQPQALALESRRRRRPGRRWGAIGPSHPARLCHPSLELSSESCLSLSALFLSPWGAGRRESRAGLRSRLLHLSARGEAAWGEWGRGKGSWARGVGGRNEERTAVSQSVLLAERDRRPLLRPSSPNPGASTVPGCLNRAPVPQPCPGSSAAPPALSQASLPASGRPQENVARAGSAGPGRRLAASGQPVRDGPCGSPPPAPLRAAGGGGLRRQRARPGPAEGARWVGPGCPAEGAVPKAPWGSLAASAATGPCR